MISENELNRSVKLLKNTIYIYNHEGSYHFALNFGEMDICFDKAIIKPVSELEDSQLTGLLQNYREAVTQKDKAQRKYKQAIAEILKKSEKLSEIYNASISDTNHGGLIGVVGNHDVGTLKAKVMLDIAYSRALSRAGNSDNETISQITDTYKGFKQAIIKGIRNTDELIEHLQHLFNLTEIEKKQLFIDLNMRIREKIFIQSMMCTGGWYSLGGDELGVCHKPEVFQEFATGIHVGSSLTERMESREHIHDFRAFIRAINHILEELPSASAQDETTMHYSVLSDELFGEKPANILFMVLRYNAKSGQYYLIGHCSEQINDHDLQQKISEIFGPIQTCMVHIISSEGLIYSYDYTEGNLTNQKDAKGEPVDNTSFIRAERVGFFNQDKSKEQIESNSNYLSERLQRY